MNYFLEQTQLAKNFQARLFLLTLLEHLHPIILFRTYLNGITRYTHADILKWCGPLPHVSNIHAPVQQLKTQRDLEGADKFVLRVLEIIEYLSPPCFFIETPWSGLLKGRAIMADLPPPMKTSYCKYGFCYQKHTAIWTNTEISFLHCKNDCNSLVTNSSTDTSGRIRQRHLSRAQRGGFKTAEGFMPTSHSLKELYSIPPLLCRHICHYVSNNHLSKGNGENQRDLRGALQHPTSTVSSYLSLCSQLHTWRESKRSSKSSTSQGWSG